MITQHKKPNIMNVGHIGNPLEEIIEIKTCMHSEYCTGNKYAMKCNYQDSQESCQLNKFYRKYGSTWEEMFI